MDREFGWNDEITEEGGNYEPLPERDYDFTEYEKRLLNNQ